MTRVAGDIDLLKRLIAAGFPVIIEKGHHPSDDWWMGHYLVLTAYDDEGQHFITQDSLLGADLPLAYAELRPWWRNFNYLYIVIYPSERESDLLGILGPQADPLYNYQYAAQIARDEIADLSGRDLYFAWYNLGTNLVALSDYTGAAGAYDQAFLINAALPETDRLHRMLWYQDGPYQAYFHTGRYTDVIELGNATLAWVGEPVLEETFYWMGLAREAQGDQEKALYDLNKVVEINPNNTQALERLKTLSEGVPDS
jgi:tetratricopeptide (TPR) repeat protein